MPFVYFIHEDGNIDCFKIGKTSMHPADRCAQLQTGNPRKLVIYRWIELENHSQVEEYLHAKYAPVHVRGEWFHVSKDIIDVECAVISSLDGRVGGGDNVLNQNVVNQHNVLNQHNVNNVNNVIVSNDYPTWTEEDILRVQNEKVAMGTYRGKHSPREAMRRKKKYWDSESKGKVWGQTTPNNAPNNHPSGFSDGL